MRHTGFLLMDTELKTRHARGSITNQLSVPIEISNLIESLDAKTALRAVWIFGALPQRYSQTSYKDHLLIRLHFIMVPRGILPMLLNLLIQTTCVK